MRIVKYTNRFQRDYKREMDSAGVTARFRPTCWLRASASICSALGTKSIPPIPESILSDWRRELVVRTKQITPVASSSATPASEHVLDQRGASFETAAPRLTQDEGFS